MRRATNFFQSGLLSAIVRNLSPGQKLPDIQNIYALCCPPTYLASILALAPLTLPLDALFSRRGGAVGGHPYRRLIFPEGGLRRFLGMAVPQRIGDHKVYLPYDREKALSKLKFRRLWVRQCSPKGLRNKPRFHGSLKRFSRGGVSSTLSQGFNSPAETLVPIR